MSTRAPEMPPATDEIGASDRLKAELASLRLAFRMLDDVDLRTNELVANLAETIRSLVELRASTSLEISAALRRIDETIDEQASTQRAVLAALRQEITAAQRNVAGLAGLAAEIGARHADLERRLAAEERAIASPASQSTQESGPAPAPRFGEAGSRAAPTREPSSPLPSAATIVLRFENVDSAATALSLQRFVSRIPGVVAVTGRRYVGTRLRLDVGIRGEVLYDDLFDWPGGELVLVAASEQGADLTVRRLRAATSSG